MCRGSMMCRGTLLSAVCAGGIGITLAGASAAADSAAENAETCSASVGANGAVGSTDVTECECRPLLARTTSSDSSGTGGEPTRGVPPLCPAHVRLLAEHYNITLMPLEPLGAELHGIDLRTLGQTGPGGEGNTVADQLAESGVLKILEFEMAARGFIVFKDQGVLSGAQQKRASELWGARKMHSTHGVHPKSPNRHIFRLSNDPQEGTLGVGPQWHNDGSFEESVFSHVGYHIVKVPEKGGDTLLAHQGAAFEALPLDRQKFWEKLTSVNSNSGVLHPGVHVHPLSRRKSIWLHLGMTGGVLKREGWQSLAADGHEKKVPSFRLLREDEMRRLFNEYNDLLNAGIRYGDSKEQEGKLVYTLSYRYEPGDCVFIDNWAISHKASESAHDGNLAHGTRVLHRTTVQSPWEFKPAPELGLPNIVTMDVLKAANARNAKGDGVWVPGGIGFRWDDEIHMQN